MRGMGCWTGRDIRIQRSDLLPHLTLGPLKGGEHVVEVNMDPHEGLLQFLSADNCCLSFWMDGVGNDDRACLTSAYTKCK